MICRFYRDSMGLLFECISNRLSIIPPHIHAIYGDDVAEVDIKSGEIIEGSLPPKALAMVKEWIEINKKDLLQMWKTQEFKKLSPLE